MRAVSSSASWKLTSFPPVEEGAGSAPPPIPGPGHMRIEGSAGWPGGVEPADVVGVQQCRAGGCRRRCPRQTRRRRRRAPRPAAMPSAELAPGRTMTSAGRDPAAGTATAATTTAPNLAAPRGQAEPLANHTMVSSASKMPSPDEDPAASSGHDGPAHLEKTLRPLPCEASAAPTLRSPAPCSAPHRRSSADKGSRGSAVPATAMRGLLQIGC